MAEEFNVPVDMQVQITMDVRTVQMVVAALGQQPYNIVSDAIASIRTQCDNQIVNTLRRMKAEQSNTGEDKGYPSPT